MGWVGLGRVQMGCLAAGLACNADASSTTGFGTGTSAASTGVGSGMSGPGTSGGATSADSTGAGLPKLDVGSNAGNCGRGFGEVTFSYIWIANTDQGTVSKIDTRTGVEEGRYRTGPDSPGGSPSRTSVNHEGSVAVSNRSPGSVTKIAATTELCVDADGDGMITTSTGPDDILDWGADECVLWNTTIPSPVPGAGPRPTAWEGRYDADCNPNDNPRLWIGFMDASERGNFRRLDGATGDVLDMIEGPVWAMEGEQDGIGPYGGAVDRDGDLWAVGWNQGHAIHIDADTLEYDDLRVAKPTQFYGMAMDAHGHMWAAGVGVARLGATDLEWTVLPGEFFRARGIGIDRDGRLWAALNFPCRLGLVDTAAMEIVDTEIPLPGCDTPVGIGIDIDGFVWVVDAGAYQAMKIDPDTYEVVLTVDGLVRPYTYSDMTGYGLQLVTNPAG